MQDDEDALESAKQAEQKQLQEIDKDMRELDRLKAERLNKKSEVDAMDEVIGKVKAPLFCKEHCKSLIYWSPSM